LQSYLIQTSVTNNDTHKILSEIGEIKAEARARQLSGVKQDLVQLIAQGVRNKGGKLISQQKSPLKSGEKRVKL